MFKSKLALSAAALSVLGAASVFAFTPVITSIPDVIIGDNTPTDDHTPGDPLTAGSTVEAVGSEPADTFKFDDAINIFNLVEDQPNNVAGFTSDDSLTYVFTATTGGVGGADANSYSIQGTTVTTTGNAVVPAVDGTLDFEDIVSAAADPSIGTIDYVFTNNLGDFNISGATVVNTNTVTLDVTNTQGNSASDEFMVYTVVNNPDAISGEVSVTTPVDLSTWTYVGLTAAGAFGPTFPGDASTSATKLADDDVDGSGNDLEVVIGSLSGDAFDQESLHTWSSPLGILAFEDGKTIRLSYSIRESASASVNLLEARARWSYGSFGRMGGGSTVARPAVNRPATDNTTFYVMFDQQDIASANNPATADPSVNENDAGLFFEGIDLFTNYQGGVELESVVIDSIDKSAVVAAQALVSAVSDFSADTTSTTIDFSTGSASVTLSAPSAVVTTSAGGVADGSVPIYGGAAFNLLNPEVKLNSVAPTATSGLIYRTEFDVSLTNNAGTPLPNMVMRTRTTEGGIPRDTTETQVTSLREDNSLNPAYASGGTFSSYHHFPDDYIADGVDGPSGSAFAYGDGISATLALQDDAVAGTLGGTVTVTGLRVYSVPENLL